jgi:hypothetical protein
VRFQNGHKFADRMRGVADSLDDALQISLCR